MITVDKTLHELQVALRFQLELEQAERAYRQAGYDISTVPDEWLKYDDVVKKLSTQRARVAELNALLRGYIR